MPVVTTVTSFFIVFRNVENCGNRFRTVCSTMGVVGEFGCEGGDHFCMAYAVPTGRHAGVWYCWSGKGVAYCCAVCSYVCIAVVCVLMYVCAYVLCTCVCVWPYVRLCSISVLVWLILVIFLVFRRMTRHFIDFSEVPFS